MFYLGAIRHSKRAGRTAIAVCAAAAFTLGCANTDVAATAEALGANASNIYNGLEDPSTPNNNAVVSLAKVNGAVLSGYCTGTLVTSTLVLTAAHCKVQSGDGVWIGPANANQGRNATQSVATRTVVDSIPMQDPPASDDDVEASYSFGDVRIVRIWPPVVTEATPQKPSLVAPAGGIMGEAGYGRAFPFNVPAGDPTLDQRPNWRLAVGGHVSDLKHVVAPGGLFAYWKLESDFSPIRWGVGKGDSGGPLYAPTASGGRDVFGIASYTDYCYTLEGIICNYYNSYWTDITAPIVSKFILAVVDPDNDGRWEGELDYPYATTAYRAAGDLPAQCADGSDPDCDGILSGRDNCPQDWNPDQYNSEYTTTLYPDSTFVKAKFNPKGLDLGDACDSCYALPGVDSNCNADAENANFGPRPRLTETDVVGSKQFPNQGALVQNDGTTPTLLAQNRRRYAGDRCDAVPCTALSSGYERVSGWGTPNLPGCQLGALVSCAYMAPNVVHRDTLGEPTLGVGDTGYRFCPCPPPFDSASDRLHNCLGPSATFQCPVDATQFTGSPNVAFGATPAFQTISSWSGTGELGTHDKFTGSPKPPISFEWNFLDVWAALGHSATPPKPVTTAWASTVKFDGLIQSNVRLFLGGTSTYDGNSAALLRDGASNWLPMHFQVDATKSSLLPAVASATTFWPWIECPQCGWGFLPPYVQVVSSPVNPSGIQVLASSPSGTRVDITPRIVPAVQTLLSSAKSGSLIGASEPAALVSARGLRAPTALVADSSMRVLGAVTASPEGVLAPFTNKRVCDGPCPQATASALDPSGAASPPAAIAALASRPETSPVAALSATRSTLYQLARSSTDHRVHLVAYDLATGTWTERALKGDSLSAPVAVTFSWRDGALYVLDETRKTLFRTVRLARIADDGSVTILASVPILPSTSLYLSTAFDGRLVVGASGPFLRTYKVVTVDPTDTGLKLDGWTAGRGTLSAAPYLDARGLEVAVAGIGAAGDQVRTVQIKDFRSCSEPRFTWDAD